MKKRFFACVLAVITLFIAIAVAPVGTADKKSGDWLYYSWVYEDTGETFAIITGYVGSGSAVTVPATIAGLRVLGLEKGTFDECDTVTSITVSEGIVAIWDGAIDYCSNLKSVYIPNSCTIVTGKSIRTCSALQNIYVSDGNSTLYTQNGVLYEIIENGIKLIKYPGGKAGKNFSVPEKVTEIDDDAFDCSFNLEKVSLPSKLVAIGADAFSSCISLKEINIPKSVLYIGDAPFSLCSSLEKITVDDSNSEFCSVGGVLYSKDMEWLIQFPAGNGVSSFVVPGEVRYIALGAFCRCGDLTFVNLSSVSEIQHMAFWSCDNLNEIVLGKRLKLIGESAFERCTSLQLVCFWGTQEDIADLSIGDGNDPLLNADLIYLPIMGDVNLDLKVNAKDVTALMKYLVGSAPQNFEEGAADYNGDGKINAKDVTALMKYIVGAK